MADPPYDSVTNEPPPPETPAERIRASSHVLVAGVAAIALGAFFGLPLVYAAAAVAALLVVAGIGARRPAVRRGSADSAGRPLVWPDTTMKATVEAFPKAAFLLDSAGTVRYANQHAAGLFPQTRPGDPFTLTFRRPEFPEALEIAGAGQSTTIEFREPGETSVTYEVTIGPLRSPGGGVNFLLVTFDDVSDRLAVARMRADFVANASHELRTPLASLTGFVETLLGSARNDPVAQEKFLRVMLDQARRMRRLIDDLLSLSRAEMRAHSRPTERVDLVTVLRYVGDAMQPLAVEHSVKLSVEVPPGPVEVIGDRDELVQLMQNLIENAIRYGASGERVDVMLTLSAEPRSLAVIIVKDYGPGIPAEHIPRLTERFYRVDVGASREMKGTGLGLAIVKHILTRHQGRLEIESKPGEGARFTAFIPFANVSAEK
jgi:two-component system, OmpR family, phosphate regulon sensor histidine kinase PhoR